MDDLKRLEFANDLRGLHHASLWEEEKHFTWLNSLILSAQVFLLTSEKISPHLRLYLAIGTALGGLICSGMALLVIRKESEYFNIALKQFVMEYNAVFSDGPLNPAPENANKTLRELLLGIFRPRTLRVRDAFQLLFIGFMVVFALMPVGIALH